MKNWIDGIKYCTEIGITKKNFNRLTSNSFNSRHVSNTIDYQTEFYDDYYLSYIGMILVQYHSGFI